MENNTIDAFLALLRAGLWENIPVHGERLKVKGCPDGASLLTLDNAQTSSELCSLNRSLQDSEHVDWEEVYQLAEEQSVIGVVLAGIDWFKVLRKAQTQAEHDSRFMIPQEVLLQWIGDVQMEEQTNKAMNQFIAQIVGKMQEKNIYTLLVKGQGVAQCYERPLWRQSGDVDLLLSNSNYKKAKDFLLPLSIENKPEERYSKHLGMNILETFLRPSGSWKSQAAEPSGKRPKVERGTSDQGRADQWYVEIHGTLRTGLSGRVDRVVDEVQKDVFYGGNVRSWNNNGTVIFLPSPDNDVFFVFTHFIKHFYKEGMSLRQVCDWCRLLWTFKDSLNHGLLESRIRKAGLMVEWKAFAALAVNYLGMPIDAVPLLDVRSLMEDGRWRKKAEQILKHILKGEPYNVVRDTWAIAKIFPWNTFKFLPAIFFHLNWLKIRERIMC